MLKGRYAQMPKESNMPDEVDLTALVEIDGETIPLSEVMSRAANKTEWQKKLKNEEKAIAEDRKALNNTLSRVVDKVTAMPPVAPTENTEEVVMESDFDLAKEMEALPDQVEDPAAYTKAHADLMRRHGEYITAQAQKQTERAVTDAVLKSEGRQAAKDANEASQQNVERLRSWAKEKGLPTSGDTFDKMVDAVGSLRGESWAEKQIFGSTVVWKYGDKAFEAGIRLVPELDAARVEEIVSEKIGEIRGEEVYKPLPPPSANASRADKLRYLRSLSEDQVIAAVNEMTTEERGQLGFAAYEDAAQHA
jgi:hypothetical protein